MAKGKRKRRIQIDGWKLLFAALILVLGITIVLVVRNIIALQIEKSELKKQEEELQAKKEELTQELQNVDDLEYIEEQARKLLRMIKPGEVLYVLNGTDPRPEQETETDEVIIPDALEKPEETTDATVDGSYDTGYTDGYYEESYDTGYTDGYYEESYDTGYTDDGYYEESYDTGYTDDGYYEESYDTGYTDGYYEESYDTGYTEEWTG